MVLLSILQTSNVLGSSRSLFDIHFGHIPESTIKSITGGGVYRLFRLHGELHDSMMSLEGFNVISIRCEDLLLDTLTQAIFTNSLDDLGTMIFLGINPTD